MLRRPRDIVPVPTSPDADLLARVDFSAWDGRTGFTTLDSRCRVWLADFVEQATVHGRVALNAPPPPPLIAASGPAAVDINMVRGPGRTPLKLHFLKMREPAFTVGLWFTSETNHGMLFGKHGITAFGKSYKTVGVRLEHGQLRADPGRLAGGMVEPGRWHHVVLSATPERLALYLDGRLVADGPGAPELTTDALDFLPDHAGAIARLAIYNREFTPDEVAQWHAGEVGR
jgi:hypothetical protein